MNLRSPQSSEARLAYTLVTFAKPVLIALSERLHDFGNTHFKLIRPPRLIDFGDVTMSISQRVRSEFSTLYRRHGAYSNWLDRVNRLPLAREFINQSPNAPRFPTREPMWDYIAKLNPGPIDYLEFGVHQGDSLLHWASANQDPKSRFFGFDSFEGLPEHWNRSYPKGYFDMAGEQPKSSDPRVSFIKGWFQDTLGAFLASYSSPQGIRRIVHIDCDLYSSTLYCLTTLDSPAPS